MKTVLQQFQPISTINNIARSSCKTLGIFDKGRSGQTERNRGFYGKTASYWQFSNGEWITTTIQAIKSDRIVPSTRYTVRLGRSPVRNSTTNLHAAPLTVEVVTKKPFSPKVR